MNVDLMTIFYYSLIQITEYVEGKNQKNASQKRIYKIFGVKNVVKTTMSMHEQHTTPFLLKCLFTKMHEFNI